MSKIAMTSIAIQSVTVAAATTMTTDKPPVKTTLSPKSTTDMTSGFAPADVTTAPAGKKNDEVPSPNLNAAAIGGGVAGSLAIVALLIVAAFIWKRTHLHNPVQRRASSGRRSRRTESQVGYDDLQNPIFPFH
ncbi:uncharacterized protein LOC106153495 [Lingula anatina]|uniref:Uncharacterized protein LOC106153495 n=1 Tax=Lingula anatina TaxID=7574 RepID=A0A1S3HA64_LINAN|nr:uncharacterized protein LOC106153495 [Lingula anatina]|eukprot:XP_013382912.1 uncharacterized protein LOC106153495 [Lingula anatina]